MNARMSVISTSWVCGSPMAATDTVVTGPCWIRVTVGEADSPGDKTRHLLPKVKHHVSFDGRLRDLWVLGSKLQCSLPTHLGQVVKVPARLG